MALIMEGAQELTVSDTTAEEMVNKDLIYPCDDPECPLPVYHLTPGVSWDRVEAAYTEGA